ncbi:hypothetical protein AJ79_00498 [Helicocarpus griseus UAMH5409]|uniref:Uncharacterized protein n=1 Tax=Helicocarpus griseus UAMH5409 TaxID=1447875 RepID=A0A2B7YBG2_9EURO|nr:hypothetical protein AJ79_00498 [Helicocarpus griseus UAMH5409]
MDSPAFHEHKATKMNEDHAKGLLGTGRCVDYTQGYGHILFPPHQYSNCVEGKRWEELVNVENSFPFMQLPIEIRNKIYEFLLEPLSGGYDGDLPEMKGGNGIRFRISDTSYYPSNTTYFSPTEQVSVYPTLQTNGRIQEGLEERIELYKSIQEGTANDAQIQLAEELRLTPRYDFDLKTEEALFDGYSDFDEDEDESDDEAEYKADQMECSRPELPPHASDIGKSCRPIYDMHVHRNRREDVHQRRLTKGFDRTISLNNYSCRSCLYMDYSIIRRLFYVSRQFTQEVGACLWRSAIINFEVPEYFFAFFEPRPAILKFVKCIELHFQYGNLCETSTETVVAICGFISKYMDLRYIRIFLMIDECCLERAVAEGEMEQWKVAFNNLRVLHGFDLRAIWDPLYLPIREERWQFAAKFEGLGKKLEELWLPHILSLDN